MFDEPVAAAPGPKAAQLKISRGPHMGILSGDFDHRLEALESRALLSAGPMAEMPTLLTGEVPVVTDDFLNPPQDEADPVGPTDGAGAGGWTGDNADVPMSYDDAGSPDFDADYRDWTWELDGTQIDGGRDYVFPGFGTVDGKAAGLSASATGPRISERPEADQTLPPGYSNGTISDADLEADMYGDGDVFGPEAGMSRGIAAPKVEPTAAVQSDSRPVASAAAVAFAAPSSLFETTSFRGGDEKKDGVKVSVLSSFVSSDMPRSDALVLPTLL